LITLLEGVMKGCVVIKTQIATEPNQCFFHSHYLMANSARALEQKGNILLNYGHIIFYYLKDYAVFH